MKASNSLWGEAVRHRPTERDEAVRERAVALLIAAIKAECSDVETDGIEDVIREALDEGTSGFRRAQLLERRGWEIDDELLDVLRQDTVHDALEEEIVAWVQAEGIKPSLEIGAKVTLKTEHFRTQQPVAEDVVAEVKSIDVRRATYTLYVEAFGHVREGLGVHGVVLPYERVEILERCDG
ncbi:MAG: hypothetical protein Q7J25_12230 [Vicinamibacterales bacterium]|nr:hypothetical protein [Vicinamibacterales bacterium]